MNRDRIDAMLRDTLADGRLSRVERRALDEALLTDADDSTRAVIRSRVFDLARAEMADPRHRATLDWIEAVVKLLAKGDAAQSQSSDTSVSFSPGTDCRRAIQGFIKSTRRKLDVCVFTITDNRIAEEIKNAHRRRVAVRILTDREKSTARSRPTAAPTSATSCAKASASPSTSPKNTCTTSSPYPTTPACSPAATTGPAAPRMKTKRT